MSHGIQDPSEIYEWDTQKLWNAFLVITQETDKYKEHKEMAKHGMKIVFPIHYLFKEDWITRYPKKKKATIKGHGRFPLAELEEEIERRETIMRQIILEEWEDTGMTESRT